MKRREFLKIAATGVASTSLLGKMSFAGVEQNKKRPNIIVLFADDLGYGEISIHGCKDVTTPNIDSIAAGGVRCTSGYVTAPACIPCRAGLITGQYQQRFGYESNSDFHLGLPDQNLTFAQIAKSAGYATGMVGKWHVGPTEKDKGQHPLGRGFDEYYGVLGNTPAYMDTENKGGINVTRQLNEELETEYLTDAHAREAVNFIDRHITDPFFLYLSFNAVHTPSEAPPKYLKRFAHIKDPHLRMHAAMISSLDEAVGRVLTKLHSENLENNTLVIFLSDHGGSAIDRFPENGFNFKGINPSAVKSVWKKVRNNSPFCGGKGSIQEGGIRVPFFLCWPDQLQAGSEYHHPVSSLDILPTVASLTSASLPDKSIFDGVNLIPYLKGENKQPPHEYLCWRWGIMTGYDSIAQRAIRMGDYKLFISRGQNPQLFNVVEDPAEKIDLAVQEPQRVEMMLAKFTIWDKQTKTNARAMKRAPLPKHPPYYDALPDEFALSEAVAIAQTVSENGVAEDLVSTYLLDPLIQMLLLEKTGDRRYRKIQKTGK